jgi:type II secretory pathway component PulF
VPAQTADPFPTEGPDREVAARNPAANAETARGRLGAEAEWSRTSARGWRLVHLMYLVAGVALFLWLWRTIGPPLLIFTIIGLLAAAVGGSIILARRRAIRQDALLWIMAIAAENRMPLAAAVEAFADQYRGKSRRRIMKLADQLSCGNSLPEALATKRDVASRDAVLLTSVGHATECLPRALRIAATNQSARLPIWIAIASRLAYLLLMLLGLQTLLGFLLYYIMPRFESIFRDFGVGLPRITVFMITATGAVIGHSSFGWAQLVELALLIFLPFSFINWGRYDVPLFDRLLARRHTALIFRSLSLVVGARKPIEFGLSLLGEHYPTRWVRRRLSAARTDVRQGSDWIESLMRHHLIRAADGEVIRSAAAVGNLGWALDELAESSERRLVIKFQMVIQTLFPVVVLLLGLVVFVAAAGYFAPLVTIISEIGER